MGIGSQLLINGLIAGSIYALVAVGFSMMYSVCKFMNFAHGAIVMISAYLFYSFSNLGLGMFFSLALAILSGGLVGLLTNVCVYKPLENKKATGAVLLIVSISLYTLLENLVVAVYGATARNVYSGKVVSFSFLGARITQIQIIIILVTLAMFGLVWYLFKRTKFGKAMRAVSDNKEVSETVGIKSEKIYNLTFFLASLIGGVAGVLFALDLSIHPFIGFNLILKGFTGAIIGGITSVPGAILGSYLLGVVENLGIWVLPSGYKDAIAFFLLFLFLLFKPTGILGIRKGVNK